MSDDDRAERVARAICAKAGYDKPWEAFNLSEQDMFRECAIAALAAAEPRWQVIETAPVDSRRDVQLRAGNTVACGWYDPDRAKWVSYQYDDWKDEDLTWTHWSPMLPPPGADNE